MDVNGFDIGALRAKAPVFVERRSVRFQEADAAGVIFFARIFEWFHDALFAYIADRGLDYPKIIASGEWGAPLRHVEADYFAPVRFPDAVEVGIVRARFDASNLYVGYSVSRNGKVVAVGATHHVVVAMADMKRIDPPAAFREVFRPAE